MRPETTMNVSSTSQQQEEMNSEDTLNENPSFAKVSSDSTAPSKQRRPSASILRRSRFSFENFQNKDLLDPSEDAPSLSSATTVSSSSSMEFLAPSQPPPRLSTPMPCVRSVSDTVLYDDGTNSSSKTLQFDPQIWVREFQRTPEEAHTTWFSQEDLKNFKSASLRTIHRYECLSNRQKQHQPLMLMFSHPSLSAANELQNSKGLVVLDDEITNILVLDPHDMCANLFCQGLRLLFPRARIVTRHPDQYDTSTTASHHQFDVIVCEERWQRLWYRPGKEGTGTEFLRSLPESVVRIGTSAHATDRKTMHDVVDLFWSKPPPRMTEALRKEIIRVWEKKRKLQEDR